MPPKPQGNCNLFASFSEQVRKTMDEVPEIPAGVGDWAVKAPVVLDRGPFSFDGHECLVQPYSDDHPRQIEMKCAQMGNTTRAILRMIHSALSRQDMVGLLYLFPSRRGSGEFSRTRVTPLIERNPKHIGRYIQHTDSVEVKRLAGKNLLFRGTRATEGLRSDPVDMIIYDEFDLFPAGVDAVAKERLSHSHLKWEHYLSNPTIPDWGIDRLFKVSDQHYWLLKCPKCNEYTCMEDTFPDCLHERPGGQVVRLCMKCRDAELDPAIGAWVPKHPSVEGFRGYHYSQLFSAYVSPESILEEYRTTSKIDAFYNYKLGLPYADAENQISVEAVLALCGTHGIASSDPGPCYMGVDQGKLLHVVVGKRHPDRLIHIGEYKDWSELDRLMREFKVSRCVVDAMPETRNARSFAERHVGKVFLCYYANRRDGAAQWHEGKLTVSVGRTEALDLARKQLVDAIITLPKESPPVVDFAKHTYNSAKKLEDDGQGNVEYVYVRLGDDHYYHAFVYETLARKRAESNLFGDADLG
jgi:hypothetical protein